MPVFAPLNSVSATGPAGAQTINVSITPLKANDVIFAIFSGNATPNLVLGPFTVSSVNDASGGNTVYNGTFTGGGGNAFAGQMFVVGPSVGVPAADVGNFICVASTAIALTLVNPNGIATTNGTTTWVGWSNFPAVNNFYYQACNGLTPVVFNANAGGGEDAWALLLIDLQNSGLASNVLGSTTPAKTFNFSSSNPISSAPFAVTAQQAIFFYSFANNVGQNPPNSTLMTATDNLGNTYLTAGTFNPGPTSPVSSANAWFGAAFGSPASASAVVTLALASTAPGGAPSGSIFTIPDLIAPTQTIAVTATVNSGFARFRLRNFAGSVPTANSFTVLAETVVDFFPNSSGVISASIWPNSSISPAGTFYTIEMWSDGRITSSVNAVLDSSVDLSNVVPISNII